MILLTKKDLKIKDFKGKSNKQGFKIKDFWVSINLQRINLV